MDDSVAREKRNGLLQIRYRIAGYDNQYRNMGETENKGFEASVNWIAIDKKNFGLSFGANISFNKNKIKSLGSLKTMSNDLTQSYWASSEIGQDYWIEVGGSVGKMYGYVSDGRYEVSDFERYDEVTETWILRDFFTICLCS